MDTAETPRPQHELARLPDLPPALRASMPPASRPTTGGAPINARLVLRGLARHWWQALAFWVIGTGALAAFIYLRHDPTYRSAGYLQVESGEAGPFRESLDSQLQTYMQTEVKLILSTSVLGQVVLDPKVSAIPSVREAIDAEEYLREILEVRSQPNTYLIEIAAEASRPTDAAVIVESVMSSFLKGNEALSKASVSRQVGRLKEYDAKLQSQIKARQDELLALLNEADDPGDVLSITPQDGEDSDNQLFAVDAEVYQQLRKDEMEVQFRLIAAEDDLATARLQATNADGGVWIERHVAEVFGADEQVQRLRGAVHDLDTRIADQGRKIKKSSDPALTRLYADRARLVEQYNQLWVQMQPVIRAQLDAAEGNPVQLVRDAEFALNRIERQKALIEGQLDRMDVKSRSRGDATLRSSFVKTELANIQAMRFTVAKRIEELEFIANGGERIVVAAEPVPIPKPLNDKRNKFLALTPVAVLGLVLGLVTLVELRAGRVSGTDDLSGRFGAEVFSVPPLPTARASASGQLSAPGGDPKFEHFVQQLDHLRVALCGEGGHDGRGRCVLITSAVGGEGKTTLAAQLAVRCAEAGASTVLIDADLRRATLGKLFEVPECPGLSDVLRGDAKIEDALVPIDQVGGCQLLPAGSPEANPNRILRGKEFGPMLERLRRSFDVVIIDTSPVLPVPDALILGRLADGAVLAARHDQSRFPAVERANALLAGAGIPVLGVVVNGARQGSGRFGAGAYAAYTYRTDRMPGGDGRDVAADNPTVA